MQPICWVASFLSTISLMGNGLFLLVVYRDKALRAAASTQVLISLAINDVALGPAFLFNSNCFYYIAEYVSWQNKVLFYLRCGYSALMLLTVAIERYLAVMKPFYHKVHVTKKWIWKLLFLAHIIPSIIITPGFFFKSVDEPTTNLSAISSQSNPVSREVILVYEVAVVCLISILPALLMSVLYGRIIYRVWFKKNAEGTNVAILKARRKMTKLLLTVTIVFYLCMLPLSFNLPRQVSDSVKTWMAVFPLMNTVLNPLIYSLHSTPFRRGIKSLSMCCLPKCLCGDNGIHGRRSQDGTINLSFINHRNHTFNKEDVAMSKNQVICLSVIDTNKE